LLERSHRREFRITALAVLALFIAQFGAIAHTYTHQPGAANQAAAHQPAADKVSVHRPTSNSPEYCGECLNFAPLLSAAGTPSVLAFALQLTQSPPPPAPPASFLDHRTYLAFRSRAPPVAR
jgi:hypothetical protein